MTDFLLFLGKLNLAMGAAIVLVCLLRRPLRAQFGAPIAYALWLLVPIAGLASLLPPRVAAPLAHLENPVGQNLAGQYPAAPMSIIRQIAHPALRLTQQLTGQSPLVHPVIAAPAAISGYGTPDYAMLLFAAWVLGTMLVALYLARLQARFHATMRLGEAGPAVLGFFRPHVVMPDSFQEQYTAAEQAAILAHERVHLARQDARINALAALLRCLCWFNPLVHLGAASMRIDQELACDATALAGPVSRRDYAKALLKSQMMVTALPLGCNWPGSQHPLIERIALLKRKRPGTARRIAGTGLVMVAAVCAGLSAWAAQPPVASKFISAPHFGNQIVLAMPPAITQAPGQNAGDAGANQPVSDANPIGSSHPVGASKVRGSKPISAAPSPSSEALPLLPKNASASATAVASNDPPAAPVQSAPPATAVTLNDQPVAPMQAATPDASAGPVQVAAAAPASAGSNPGSPARASFPSACPSVEEADGAVPQISPGPFDNHLRVLKGTVISVHTDPQLPGTDIVLGNREDDKEWIGRRDVVVVLIPIGNVKDFPALDGYVGQKVCIFASAARSEPIFAPNAGILEITDPRQLYLLSTAAALASAGSGPVALSNSAVSHGVRPEITQHLTRMQSLYDSGFSLGAMKQLEAAEAVPNQTDEEKKAVAHIKARVMGGNFPLLGSGPAQDPLDRSENLNALGGTPLYTGRPPDQAPNVPHPY